jgi:hypothetical protein
MAAIAVALLHSSVPLALTEALPPDGVAVSVLRDMLARQLRSRVRLVDGVTFKPLRSGAFLSPPAFVRVTFVHPRPRRERRLTADDDVVLPPLLRLHDCTFASLFRCAQETLDETLDLENAPEDADADEDEDDVDADVDADVETQHADGTAAAAAAPPPASTALLDKARANGGDADDSDASTDSYADVNTDAYATATAEPRPPCPSGALAVGLVIDVHVQCMRCLRAGHGAHTLVGVAVAHTTRTLTLSQVCASPADVAAGLVAAELAVRVATAAVPACRRLVLHTSVIGLDTPALQACAGVQRAAASRPVAAAFVACTAPEATALRRAMVRADARGAYFRLPKGQAGTVDGTDDEQ